MILPFILIIYMLKIATIKLFCITIYFIIFQWQVIMIFFLSFAIARWHAMRLLKGPHHLTSLHTTRKRDRLRMPSGKLQRYILYALLSSFLILYAVAQKRKCHTETKVNSGHRFKLKVDISAFAIFTKIGWLSPECRLRYKSRSRIFRRI